MDDECPICTLKMILPTAVDGCGHKFCFLCIKGVALKADLDPLCPMCRGPLSLQQFDRPNAADVSLDMRDPEDGSQTQDTSFSDAGSADRKIDVKVKKEIKDEPVDVDDNSGAKVAKATVPVPVALKLFAIPDIPARRKREKVFWMYKARGGGWWRYDPRTEKEIEDAKKSKKNQCEILACGSPYVVDFTEMVQYPRGNPDAKRVIQRVVGKNTLENLPVKGIAGVPVR